MPSTSQRTFSPAEAAEIHDSVAREGLTDSLTAWASAGDRSRYIFLHPWEFWPHHIVHASAPVRMLPEQIRRDVASFPLETRDGTVPLDAYVAASTVDGVVIVHEGAIVFEAYPRMQPWDKHLLFSLSKVVVGAVVARLEDAGTIDHGAPVPAYLEPLAGTEWDRVTVLDLLDMCSGMDCPIEFGRSGSCFERMYDAYGFPLPKASATALTDLTPFLASIGRSRPPGEVFEYLDVNTVVLTLIVEKVTGLRFADVVGTEIWAGIGAEADATIIAAAFGRAATPMGFSSTVRDLARLGLAFVPENAGGSSRIYPGGRLRRIVHGSRPELFASSSTPNMFGTTERLRNSYHWDHVTDEGDLFKHGHAGQGLYVSPSRRLVIAYVGTWRPDGSGHQLSRVARAMATSPLFAQA